MVRGRVIDALEHGADAGGLVAGSGPRWKGRRRSASERPRPLTILALSVVALVPLAIAWRSLRPVDDPDAFWHILSGQNVWRTHEVVVTDPFNRFSTNPWVQIDWLSDLAMAATHRLGGFPAIAWLFTVLSILLFLTLYACCRQGAGPVLAGITALLGWMGTYASQGFRPQTVSFILLGVTVLAWTRVSSGGARTPWWLIPLTYVWACLHGLWILGPLVGLVVVLGTAIDRGRPGRQLARLLAVPVVSLLAAALTPIGPRLLSTPLNVNSYAGLVSEWRPPDIHEPYVAVTVLLLAVTAVVWARSAAPVASAELLLWLMALGWTLLYARTVAVGAVLAAPLAAGALGRVLHVPHDPVGVRLERLMISVGTAAAIVVAGLLAPTQAAGTGTVPAALGPAIDRLPRDTVVFNDDAAGGWLLLEFPRVHPVIDTRTYLFSVPYIKQYILARSARGDWSTLLRTTGATAALLPEGGPLVQALTGSPGWVVSGRGDGFVLLTAPVGGPG